MIEPDYRQWTPEVVRAFLASQDPFDALTSEDLAVYVKMRQACDAAFGGLAPRSEADRKRKAELYADFRKARARWWHVLHRLHPTPRPLDVHTLSPEGP